MTTYVCEGCQTSFTGTAEEAFQLGWDTPERFMSHCTCPTCPIDRTAWWKIVVMKQQPTLEEHERILAFNVIYRASRR